MKTQCSTCHAMRAGWTLTRTDLSLGARIWSSCVGFANTDLAGTLPTPTSSLHRCAAGIHVAQILLSMFAVVWCINCCCLSQNTPLKTLLIVSALYYIVIDFLSALWISFRNRNASTHVYCAWSFSPTAQTLPQVLEAYDRRQTQLRIENFLSFRERFAKIRSKRLAKALKGITGIHFNL